MKTLRGSRTNYLWLDLGPFFSGYAPFFQDALKKNAGGLGPAIISGPIWGRFLQDPLAFFHDILNKNAGGLGPAIISSPIQRRFFQDTLAFFFSGYGSPLT